MPGWGWHRPWAPLGTAPKPRPPPGAPARWSFSAASPLFSGRTVLADALKLCRASGLAGWCYAVGDA